MINGTQRVGNVGRAARRPLVKYYFERIFGRCGITAGEKEGNGIFPLDALRGNLEMEMTASEHAALIVCIIPEF